MGATVDLSLSGNENQEQQDVNLMFIGPCIILIVE